MTAIPDAADGPLVDEIHLLGVPPLAGYVDHVARRTIAGDRNDEAVLIDQWRAAAAHYQRLEQSEAGEADRVQIEPIPASMSARIDALVAEPGFSEGFGELPIAFGMVELDRLVVYQQHVSLSHAARFDAVLTEASSAEQAVFGICLPEPAHLPPIRFSKSGRGRFVFQSDVSDLRSFGARFLAAGSHSVMTPNGPAPAGIAIPVGFGVRHLNVVRLGQRMVLNNGYHRAYALRAAGITHAPCIVQAIAHPEELAFAGGSSLIANYDELFKSPRPPLFKDFFNPELTVHLRLPATRKQVQVTITIETLRVPA